MRIQTRKTLLVSKVIFPMLGFILMIGFMSPANAKKLILDGFEESILLKDYLNYYEDKSGNFTIDSILKKDGQSISFLTIDPSNRFFTRSSSVSYWFKIEVKNNSAFHGHYVFESFNYRIDSFIVYETMNKKVLSSDSSGVGFDFHDRKIEHKNLAYSFWVDPEEEKIIYIKIKSRYETPVDMVCRQLEYFTSYALSEYFFLGIFYGSILLIILLNILTGAYLKSMTHYFYTFYVCSVGIFFLCQDGIGFQYFWPQFPVLNDYALMLSVYGMTVFLLLYTNSFLDLKTQQPVCSKIIYYYIVIRSVLLIINVIFFPEIRHMLYIDIVPFFLAYYCGYLAYKGGYALSKYFLIGCTILISGFLLNYLQLFGLLGINIYTFYFVNICFLLEMIVFYLTLAERIRYYKQQKEISVGLQKIIDDKEQLIEQFTYKTSHDLSGPVKTILGVTNLALSEKDSVDHLSYIKMIQTTAQRLDDVLKSIAEINIIREQKVEKALVDIKLLLEKVLQNGKVKEYSDQLEFKIENNETKELTQDLSILCTLIANLLIYQLTCLQQREDKTVHINVSTDKDSMIIETFNIGVKIPPDYHKEVFKIFFRLSNENTDIGTYLYLVKLCAEKLGGAVSIKNIEDTSYFRIRIPL